MPEVRLIVARRCRVIPDASSVKLPYGAYRTALMHEMRILLSMSGVRTHRQSGIARADAPSFHAIEIELTPSPNSF